METILRVECYAGYRGDERPQRFVLAGRAIEIAAVEDKWYSPGATYFRVLDAEGHRYVLRHEDAQDVWSLEGFRSSRQEEEPLSPARDISPRGPVN